LYITNTQSTKNAGTEAVGVIEILYTTRNPNPQNTLTQPM